jgi:hypothetical protein
MGLVSFVSFDINSFTHSKHDIVTYLSHGMCGRCRHDEEFRSHAHSLLTLLARFSSAELL